MSENKYENITWLDWCDKYKPINNPRNPDDETLDFDCHDQKDIEYIDSIMKTDPNRVWTSLDVDGNIIISNGRHYVNRQSYHVTEVPATVDFVEVVDE